MEILALNKQMKDWFPGIDVTKRPVCYRSFNTPPRETECSYCVTKKTFVDGQVHETITETPAGDKIINYRIVSSPIKDESGKVVAAIEMVEDITKRKQTEKALRNIVEGTSPVIGQDFFRILVKHLASALGVQHAFVGELIGEQPDSVQTVVAWSGADYGENFQYKLAGTPCENVIGKELCCYPQGIREMFPDDHLLADMDAESYLGAPLLDSSGEPLGILAVLDNKPIENTSLVKSIVSIFAGRAAAELERQHAEDKTLQLLQQNRELTQRLFQIQEEERRHLARELHDEFGQWLTAIHLNAETISQLSKGKNPHVHDSATAIDESATEMHKNIRDMIRQLRPTLLDELGLVESLKHLLDQWQAQHPEVELTLALDGKLDYLEDNLNITLYRIIQESLTNVAKYADARDVAVELMRREGRVGQQDSLLLNVEDNGKGMDTEAATEGFGLAGMRERVLAVGGKFTIHSPPGKGMRIEISIPLNERENV
jgi:signal transduction histidine kinase